MGLTLKSLSQGNTADLEVVLLGGELGLDAWVNMLQIRPFTRREFGRTGWNELQPGSAG